MADFWRVYVGRLLEKAFSYMVPDSVHLQEDMAYKSHPMISPEMTREYLLPSYQYWGEIIRDAGVPVYAMDSDGYVADLIPIWIDAGINVCDPMEVAAGNDIVAYREPRRKERDQGMILCRNAKDKVRTFRDNDDARHAAGALGVIDTAMTEKELNRENRK